ncbi:MAG: ornithine cyclodeaminase family protein [Rhodospirillales bacterium]|nr:ornithine cyclodeaminase family protein [Rhodospirillales bacterium]
MNQDRYSGVVLLSGRELQDLVDPLAAMTALREAYRALADHPDDQGRSLGFAIEDGSIHVKAGLLPGSRAAFAAKVNVNLPGNWQAHRLPTIQGLVVLADTKDGRPLSIMESSSLTAIRTAAAAALAARYGARPESRIAAVIGCGVQARHQLTAFRAAFPIDEVRAYDVDPAKAEAFARAADATSQPCRPVANVRAAVDGADICITCTTATAPVLTEDLALTGCFVAAVGADNPTKQEIHPGLFRRARVLVDDLEACAAGGDLFHALKAGAIKREDVHADLAELAAGRKAGRTSPDELVIFDSTGSGVQDVAVAWVAYRAARDTGRGIRFDLSGG